MQYKLLCCLTCNSQITQESAGALVMPIMETQRLLVSTSSSSICVNSSFVKVPGFTPLTSRPNCFNLELSADVGRAMGKISIVIVIGRNQTCENREALAARVDGSFLYFLRAVTLLARLVALLEN